ncbi:hypothetical protein [Psychroserpens mesophilus]|uniref:hypothetical protein n=1 Tax=Psychroserpens mesophilus TaxID=325473 RepID=UPI003F498181
MKRNILLIAAATFLFLGNQSMTAQTKIKKETQSAVIQKSNINAKEKTMNLIRPLGLNDKQQEQVYSLFEKTEEKMGRAGTEADAKQLEAKQAKIDQYIMSKMKEILNEEQYNKYLELVKDF